MTLETIEFHPIASLFPLMEGDEFEALAFDIQVHGLLQPIVKYKGMILDGRNRYLACGSSEVMPKFIEYKGDDPAGFVTSMNIERRHLTPTQRACIGVELLPFYKKAANERQGTRTDISQKVDECYGRATDFVAEKVHVNRQYISDAESIKEKRPELFDEMKGGLIHLKEALHKIHEDERTKQRQKIADEGSKIPPSEKWHVWQADVNTWKAPRQYDFIITDPPYPKEYLPLWNTLAKRAGEWLKPGGLLVAMSGGSYLNEIIKIFDEHLAYYWTGCYLTPGQTASLRQKQVNTQWKPILIYSVGDEYKGKIFSDVYQSDKNDKNFHEWGQSTSGMLSIVKQICLPGQYILDPFCGAGATGVAAIIHGCLFDGIDIEIDNVNIAKARLNDASKE